MITQAPIDNQTTKWKDLAGRRFGLLGFGSDEQLAIKNAIEATEAFCRVLPPSSDEASWLAFDALIIQIDDPSIRQRLDERNTPKTPPVLMIGGTDSLAEAMPLLQKTGGDFLRAGAWGQDDLLLRMSRLSWKSSVPAANGAVKAQPKILILDDDNSIVSILKVVLTKAGFECHTARDGGVGLDMAHSLKPDLMIVDVNMPNRSGFEVLKMLGQSPETATIRTMMLSSCEQEADILRGFGLGADDYVTKPFNPMEVAARVKSLLGRKK